MSESQHHIVLTVTTDYEADAGEIGDLTQRLRDELLETDVDNVQPVQGEALPEGAKAVGAIDWSSLWITLSESGDVLVGLVGVLSSWIKRNKGTEVTLDLPNQARLTLKSTNVTQENIHEMLQIMRDSLQSDK
jgi:hypothetical protein